MPPLSPSIRRDLIASVAVLSATLGVLLADPFHCVEHPQQCRASDSGDSKPQAEHSEGYAKANDRREQASQGEDCADDESACGNRIAFVPKPAVARRQYVAARHDWHEYEREHVHAAVLPLSGAESIA